MVVPPRCPRALNVRSILWQSAVLVRAEASSRLPGVSPGPISKPSLASRRASLLSSLARAAERVARLMISGSSSEQAALCAGSLKGNSLGEEVGRVFECKGSYYYFNPKSKRMRSAGKKRAEALKRSKQVNPNAEEPSDAVLAACRAELLEKENPQSPPNPQPAKPKASSRGSVRPPYSTFYLPPFATPALSDASPLCTLDPQCSPPYKCAPFVLQVSGSAKKLLKSILNQLKKNEAKIDSLIEQGANLNSKFDAGSTASRSCSARRWRRPNSRSRTL